MAASARSSWGEEGWESISGWMPVYTGLNRFRLGLALRLVFLVITSGAVALAATYGPTEFLKATLVVRPLLALSTSVLMVLGLVSYSKVPQRTGAKGTALVAAGAFGLLLALDVVHSVLGFTLIGEAPPPESTVGFLHDLAFAERVLGLISLGTLLVSLRQLAIFVGAVLAVTRIRAMLAAAGLVLAALIAVDVMSATIAEISPGLLVGVWVGVLGCGVLLLASAIQVADNLKDCLRLTTAEYRAVGTPARRREG